MAATGAPSAAHVLVFLLALYLSTDLFFFLGFINFRYAVALTVAALALAQMLRRRYSLALFLTYCLAIAFGYLMHLAFVVFAAAAIGASGLFRLARRTTTVGSELTLLLPVGADHVIPSRWATGIHRDWNSRYVWPRFVTALPSEFFAAVWVTQPAP